MSIPELSNQESSLEQLLAPSGVEDGRSTGLCLLPDYAVFRVTGSDARDFLSRQLSCDVELLSPTRSVHGAWLSAKGRVLALARLLEHAGEIVMLLDEAVSSSAVSRMRMFVLRSDVRIESAPELRVVGMMRTAHSRTLPPLHGAGAVAGTTASWNGLSLVALAADDSRVLLLGEEPALRAACATLLEQGARALDVHHWNRLEVEAGVARLDAANVDAFIPQMLNLDRTQGISFSKGCYPGQEIVARTQHLGRIKRRMFTARLGGGDGVIGPGSSVHAASRPDMAIGRVVRVAPGSDGGLRVLAVIALDSVRTGDALSVSGVALEGVSEPPYGLSPHGG